VLGAAAASDFKARWARPGAGGGAGASAALAALCGASRAMWSGQKKSPPG